jgi:mannose-6-phosphate isomerase
MTATRLSTKYVEKPWGRTDLPATFPEGDGRQIGEVWFDGPEGRHPPLLVKYIFTSERLSIQVHPTDEQGRERGLAGGKSECWIITATEPGATLGIGTLETLSGHHLKEAALSGEIETLMDWKPVKPGDFFYIPAGTVHAIGAGVTLVEVQQNVDVTYRLYDYGRPRELHLVDGVAVSVPRRYERAPVNIAQSSDATLLAPGDAPFTLDLTSFGAGQNELDGEGERWFVPLEGKGLIDGQPWEAGECWLIDGLTTLDCDGTAKALIAAV